MTRQYFVCLEEDYHPDLFGAKGRVSEVVLRRMDFRRERVLHLTGEAHYGVKKRE